MILNRFYVDELIKTAICEDIHYVDVTTDYLIDENAETTAKFVSKADGVVCGLEIALRVFTLLDDRITFEVFKKDGDEVKKGELICKMRGNTRALLKGERTALNLIQHMSGIATATHHCVKLVEGTNASVVDTRKTLPGLRPLQKYAVTCGGGKNHRYNLSDAAMLKDNHIDAYGGITAAVEALRKKAGHMVKIEVETRTLDDLREALAVGADIIMLDNMDHDTMAEAIGIIDGRAEIEISGNVDEAKVEMIRDLKVDYVSSGALTHSSPILDLSLKNMRRI